MSSLLYTSYSALKKTHHHHTLVMSYALSVLLHVMSSVLLSQLFVGCYLILELVRFVYDKHTHLYQRRVFEHVNQEFLQEELSRYEALDQDSKTKTSVQVFHSRLMEAKGSVFCVLEWGLSVMMHLLAALFSCTIVFCINQQTYMLVTVVGLTMIWYKFKIKPLESCYTKKQKECTENNERIGNLLQLFLPLFRSKQKRSQDILTKYMQMEATDNATRKAWDEIHREWETFHRLGLIFTCLYSSSDPMQNLVLITIYNQFVDAIHGFKHYSNQFQTYAQQFNHYQELFAGKTNDKQYKSLSMPKLVKIHRIELKLEKRLILCYEKELQWNRGDKILLTGASGSGKTTLIDGLSGKIKGIYLSKHLMQNYQHEILVFEQKVREFIPSAKVTIRELFQDCNKNDVIEKCLRLCHVMDSIQKWRTNERKGNQSTVYDVYMEEKLSGGEKTRLILASFLANVLLQPKSKTMLILDEPEQGSDPQVAYSMLRNILALFQNKTILVVSHLEHADSQLQWTQHWHLSHGTLKRVRG